jgi:glycerol-3-phosphate acyltransferase PlsY
MGGRLTDATGCAAGYLIGSVPVGVLIGRGLRGIDVRERGSGSMGTTNVLRIVGPAAAATTFGLDVAKGSAAVLLARRLGGDRWSQAVAGFAAVVGHSWPVLARFRGGKGVATAFGALLLLSPQASAFAVTGGLTALAASRTMSLGSLSAAGAAVVGAGLEALSTGDNASFGFAAPATALITIRHAANIRRLLRGEEPRVSLHHGAVS